MRAKWNRRAEGSSRQSRLIALRNLRSCDLWPGDTPSPPSAHAPLQVARMRSDALTQFQAPQSQVFRTEVRIFLAADLMQGGFASCGFLPNSIRHPWPHRFSIASLKPWEARRSDRPVMQDKPFPLRFGRSRFLSRVIAPLYLLCHLSFRVPNTGTGHTSGRVRRRAAQRMDAPVERPSRRTGEASEKRG